MKASVHSSMDFTVCLVVLGLASMPPFSLICNVLPEQMSDNSVDPFNKRARLMYCKFRIFSLINLGTWAVMSSPPHLIVPRLFEEKWRDTVFGFPWGVVRGAWRVVRGAWCVVPSF